MLACIQCSMKALLAGEPSPVFDETPEEHMQRCHPDIEATLRERMELAQQFEVAAMLAKAKSQGNGQ